MRQATIITDEPIIEVIAEMKLNETGVLAMAEWVKRYRPDCVPESGFTKVLDLVPHDGIDWHDGPCDFCPHIDVPGHTDKFRHPHRNVTDNELLCELAGRKCYDSFAEKGAKRTNGEYLASMWTGRGVPHRSTSYHAKFTFFIAHVSRRVSHELIRNYVGADRDEEGSPSQESTRFTEHPGVYIAHPREVAEGTALGATTSKRAASTPFQELVEKNYIEYIAYMRAETAIYEAKHGVAPKGMDRKRIYEAASGRLLMSCATSFIWTTNPAAMAKFFHERCDEASDLEMQRFANKWKRVCLDRWPNLFPMVTR